MSDFEERLDGLFLENLAEAFDEGLTTLSVEEATADWLAFARQCTIISGTNVTRFDPYPYQIDAFQQVWTHRGTIFGKVRQMGLTELIGNIFLWKSSKSRAYSAAVFSQTGDDTALISERVITMASSHPGIRLRKSNIREVALYDGGKILFRTSTGEGSRGLPSLDDILADEWGFVKEDKKIWGAATPAQSMSGDRARTIVVSTPPKPGVECEYSKMLLGYNGDRDIYKITKDMREGRIAPVQYWTDEGGWCKFFVHWKANPVYAGRDDYLGEVQKDNRLSEAVLQREHNLNLEARAEDSTIDLDWFPRFTPAQIPGNPWLVIQSWDTAQTDNKKSSYWAGVTFVCFGSDIFIVDAIIERYLSPDGEAAIKRFAQKWKPHHVLIENKSSGLDIIPRLRDDRTFPFPIVPIQPDKSSGRDGNPKVLRFEQELPVIKYDHRVWLPDRASGNAWVSRAERDLEGFPISKERDFPDALSQGLKYIREYAPDAFTAPIGLLDPFLNGAGMANPRLHGIL